MIIKTLEDLQQPDEASLRFTPLGLGPKMRPEDAAEYQQKIIARFDLSSQVPETTRNSFERVRTIYSYGVLCYELYTVAGDQARLVIEQALRDRFLPFYDYLARHRELTVRKTVGDVFDKLNAPHTDFIARSRIERWLATEGLTDVYLSAHLGVSWRGSATRRA